MKHPPIVFIDIETTSGSARESKIIDIGAVRVENGMVTRTINQLINPNITIPYFITRLTGITNEMVWNAPSFSAIAEELEDILNGAIFAAHHIDFDYNFVKHEFEKNGVKFNHNRLCTVKLSRLLYPAHKRHGLDKIIQRMGITVQNRHRGYDDAEVLYKFFNSELNLNQNHLNARIAEITIRARRSKFKSVTNQLSLLNDK